MKNPSSISSTRLLTLYEVGRKINTQLDPDRLLDELMDLAIGLLEAEKGLILWRDSTSDELVVKTARHIDKKNMDDVVALSRSTVKKVEQNATPVLLKNIPDSDVDDVTSSIVQHRIKSVICVPLKCKNNLVGVIYLDTTREERFFKEEDLAFMEGFANLAAVAIENAKSYREIEDLNVNLERKVQERTEELARKNDDLNNAYEDLKNAQMQLIRSEKMASLGQLVAGIAHEINTPLGVINGNTTYFAKGFEKLRAQIAGSEIQGAATEIVGTMDTMARSSADACERISGIVKSLKEFARLDEGGLQDADLHEGLDNTLALITHLTAGRIDVVREYGDIPAVRCRANQINQVFMSVLVNACQSIEGSGVITINTDTDGDTVRTSIADTGIGIPDDNLKKIFDPGFTTKGVGVGTGLSLSIAYNIIDEHGGEISVESEVSKGTNVIVRLPTTSAG
jgi:signal transduction histidine kinase